MAEEQRDTHLVNNVLAWVSTAGLVMVVGWAYSVGGDLRALSGLPARVAALEGRLNQAEREAAHFAAALAALRERADRLQEEMDRMRNRP